MKTREESFNCIAKAREL